MKRRALLLSVAALAAITARERSAVAQTIAPSERALSASQVEELVAEYRAQLRDRDAQLATQQQALRRTEEQLRRAEDFFRRQIEELGADTDPRRVAALSVYTSGRRQEALEALFDAQREEQTRVAKEQAARWRQIGALALGVDTNRAAEAFEQVLVYDPNDFEILLLLTDLYIQLNQSDRALAVASRAVSSAPPGQPRVHASLAAGRSLLSGGRVDEAVAFYETARTTLVSLLGDPANQGEALRLSYYFAFQYGSLHAAIGNLVGAERWFEGQISFLRSQLAGRYSADLQYALPMTLIVAASNSTRLGLKQVSLARVNELGRLLQVIDPTSTRDTNLLALISGAQLTISSVALRFESDATALSAAAISIECARRAVAIDGTNSYLQMALSQALSIGAWASMLTGDLTLAQARADEAVVVATVLHARAQDFFSTLTYAIALLYQGVQRFLATDRATATALIARGLEIAGRFEDLSVRNATLGLTIWYLRAAAAAASGAVAWEQFEAESRRLATNHEITQYEFDYVRAVRLRLFRTYRIAP